MKAEELIEDYLECARVMQVASVRGGQPWVCSVWFVHDAGKFYWMSYPERRHSGELADDSRAAIAIVIKPEKPVVGVQAEGMVHEVTDPEVVKKIAQKYTAKYAAGKGFYERFVAGTNKHRLYCFSPVGIVLFDETDGSSQASAV